MIDELLIDQTIRQGQRHREAIDRILRSLVQSVDRLEFGEGPQPALDMLSEAENVAESAFQLVQYLAALAALEPVIHEMENP